MKLIDNINNKLYWGHFHLQITFIEFKTLQKMVGKGIEKIAIYL